MSSFIAAYAVVWCGLLAFVARLSLKQRQLAAALEAAQEQMAQHDSEAPSTSAAGRRAVGRRAA